MWFPDKLNTDVQKDVYSPVEGAELWLPMNLNTNAALVNNYPKTCSMARGKYPKGHQVILLKVKVTLSKVEKIQLATFVALGSQENTITQSMMHVFFLCS